jgi:hypothetical protein
LQKGTVVHLAPSGSQRIFAHSNQGCS